MATVYTIGLR